MKLFFFVIISVVIFLSAIIFKYSEVISEKLTYNLNKNLDVDWGDGHQKFTKKNLVVDILDMSITWDFFNVLFSNTKTALITNALSNIQLNNCISKVRILFYFKIDIKCSEIKINQKSNEWDKFGKFYISRNFFFERRVFDDFFDKQGNFRVSILANNLVLNDIDLGEYLIKYSFYDENHLQLKINERNFKITKKNEGLKINTPDSEFFILNKNFFENK